MCGLAQDESVPFLKKPDDPSTQATRSRCLWFTLIFVIAAQTFCIGSLLPRVNVPGTYPLEGNSNPFERYFDSVATGKGVWKWRQYFPAYERHLGKFRGRKDVHIGEIGIYSGGSLEMWQQVFGPDAYIYGIDISNSTKVYEEEDTTNHTRIFIGDQGQNTFWDDFQKQVPKLDVIIDDGGHSLEEMEVTLKRMLFHLRPGGVFITEDITGAKNEFFKYCLKFFQELHHDGPKDQEGKVKASKMQDIIDSVHYYPWLLVVEKRETPRNYLQAPMHGTQWNPSKTIRIR